MTNSNAENGSSGPFLGIHCARDSTLAVGGAPFLLPDSWGTSEAEVEFHFPSGIFLGIAFADLLVSC
jgi:hypothetical protein